MSPGLFECQAAVGGQWKRETLVRFRLEDLGACGWLAMQDLQKIQSGNAVAVRMMNGATVHIV